MPQIKLSIMLHISNRCAVLAMALGLMCGEADANLNLLYTIENNDFGSGGAAGGMRSGGGERRRDDLDSDRRWLVPL